MSEPMEYVAVIKAICATPPFKNLVAKLREEPLDDYPTAGNSRRDIAAKFLVSEFRRIINAVRDTEKAAQVVR